MTIITCRPTFLFNFDRPSVSNATKFVGGPEQTTSFFSRLFCYLYASIEIALVMRRRFQSNNLPSRFDFVFVFRFRSMNY